VEVVALHRVVGDAEFFTSCSPVASSDTAVASGPDAPRVGSETVADLIGSALLVGVAGEAEAVHIAAFGRRDTVRYLFPGHVVFDGARDPLLAAFDFIARYRAGAEGVAGFVARTIVVVVTRDEEQSDKKSEDGNAAEARHGKAPRVSCVASST
jgi:hypothetical protein